jgi:hypothetical protein
MTRSRIIIGSVVLAGVLAYLGVHWSWAADEKGGSSDSATAQKVYLVYVDAPAAVPSALVLTSLRREEFQGIPCLTGDGVEGQMGVKGAAIVRVPSSRITTIIEFENTDAWKKSRARASQ